MNRITRRAALAAGALLPGAPAIAQGDWPTKPVRIIVPFPPGGLVDLLARSVSQSLTTKFGQPFVVENRGGAGGNIGADVVAKAAADGYTIMAGSLGPLAVNQYIYPSMPYDTNTAFAPIVLLATTPKVLCCANARPWQNVAALIAEAKARPGQLTAGSAGSGSSLHFALELFKEATGTNIQHVPYRGAAPAVTDLVAGNIDFVIDNVPNILAQIRGRSVRALATPSTQRLAQLPDVPTMAEAGVSNFVFGTAFGMAAPAGTAPDICRRIAEAVTEALRDPTIGGRLTEIGAVLGGGTPDDFARAIAREKETLEPVIRRAGIRAD